jgi:polyphosphate kinase
MPREKSDLINRELSWLEFNQRVLDEANDATVPLLERLFFLTITASNLDEFFMVRVGGLKLMIAGAIKTPGPAGLRPVEQLARIQARVAAMVASQYAAFLDRIEPALLEQGIGRLTMDALDGEQREAVDARFTRELFPLFSPIALRPDAPFPLLANLSLHLAVMLAPEGRKRTPRFAVVPLGPHVRRIVPVPSREGRYEYVLIEDLLAAHVGAFFTGQEILECCPFRITRNAGMSVEEEIADDLVREMRKVLSQRRTSDCVRLEVDARMSVRLRDCIVRGLRLTDGDVQAARGPLDVTGLRALLKLDGYERLRYPPWTPQQPAAVDPRKPMFEQIRRQDIALSHPFEGFHPVIRFIQEAAEDPDVLAIKQVLYRVSADSPIVAALHRAAEKGKHVTVLVELKARFDEASNIAWAQWLERAGTQVVYGIKNLKTHAKVCLVIRREEGGIVRYCHFGSGNYNDATARLYTDVGLLTANPDLGADASAFFNAVTGYSAPQPYLKLVQAPTVLREHLIELIGGEAERSRQGQKAQILAKMNALVDPKVIQALYDASQAGVDIQLNVRGICCLRPGVKGLSENIRVVSIVDRFLEHSRIFCFRQGGAKRLYLSSADWMPRNLIKRIELLVPVEAPAARRKLLAILKTCLSDTVKSRVIQADGTYKLPTVDGRGKSIRSQLVLYEEACRAAEETAQQARRTFEPHLPPQAADG